MDVDVKARENARHCKWFKDHYKNDLAFREKVKTKNRARYHVNKLKKCVGCGVQSTTTCKICDKLVCPTCMTPKNITPEKIIMVCNDCFGKFK